MRALGYFRAKDGGHRRSFESEFTEYCYLNLHQAMETFVDAAGPDRDAWPQLELLIGYISKSGSSFLVVVPDATHLGADLETVARSIVRLEATGAKVVCGDEEVPDPLQSACQLLGVEGVSQSRSARIRESMLERALEGRSLGRASYGYRAAEDGTFEVVPHEAEVVRLIFRLYTEEGMGLRRIAQRLNGGGMETRRGGNWSLVGVRDVLRNPAYTGTYSRFGMRLPRNHEAIVPQEVFRKARDTAMARRPRWRRTRSESFLLTGLAYCASCGSRMIGATRRQTWRRQDGQRAGAVYRYYQCQARQNQGRCGYHTWRSADLESRVGEELAKQLQSAASSPECGAALDGDRNLRAEAESRVVKAESNLVRVIRRAASGEMSADRLAPYLDELDRLRNEASEDVEPFDDQKAVADWSSLTPSQARQLLDRNVKRVIVADDEVQVVV